MRHARRLVTTLLLGFLLAPLTAAAAECAGARLPDAVEVEGVALRLNGAGVRSVSFAFLDFDVYVAALYVETPARTAEDVLDARGTRRLVLHFRRDTPRARLSEGFAEAFARAAPGDASLQAPLARLNGWMRDMQAGSDLAFDFAPAVGTIVTVAGERRGVVPGAGFARVLLGNWLGPHAVDARVEAGLLGAPCG